MRTGRLFALGLGLGLPALVQAAPGEGDYRPSPPEEAFLQLLRQGKPIEAREAARKHLAVQPRSFLALMTIGIVYHDLEGDLPRAEHHLRRARLLMEHTYPTPWANGSPWRHYARTLIQLHWVYQGLERFKEGIQVLDIYEAHFWPKRTALYGWPLMKLGRIDEARMRLDEALKLGNPEEEGRALNTLAAIESEVDHPDQALAISERLKQMVRLRSQNDSCTYLRNHGEYLSKLGRPAEAEQAFLEATRHFAPYSYSNPWKDLAGLYLGQQRFPEAIDAIRRMQHWAHRAYPQVTLGNWNHRQTLIAHLLYQCGYTEEALKTARRLVELPDRHGGGSAQGGLWTVGSLLFCHQVLQDALARDEETLSFAPWKERPALWLKRSSHVLLARSLAQRAARELMAKPLWLTDTLRVLAPNNAVSVPGGEVMLAQVIGPGLVEAEAGRLLARSGAGADRERGYLQLFRGAARVGRGEARGALEALALAEAQLPQTTILERNQLLALRAKAQALMGDRLGELQTLQTLMARDGGAVRRFGLSLPCRIEAVGGPPATQAASLLKGSPRLRPGASGFRLVIQASPAGLQGSLLGPGGETYARFGCKSAQDAERTALDFCRVFHHKAFGPNIDLSQQQINSLSGSNLTAQDLRDQLKGLLGQP